MPNLYFFCYSALFQLLESKKTLKIKKAVSFYLVFYLINWKSILEAGYFFIDKI